MTTSAHCLIMEAFLPTRHRRTGDGWEVHEWEVQGMKAMLYDRHGKPVRKHPRRRNMVDLLPALLLNLMLGIVLVAVSTMDKLGAGSSVMMVWWW